MRKRTRHSPECKVRNIEESNTEKTRIKKKLSQKKIDRQFFSCFMFQENISNKKDIQVFYKLDNYKHLTLHLSDEFDFHHVWMGN